MPLVHPTGLPDAIVNLDRCIVVGVVNVTPDSFSDGGQFLDTASAVAQGRVLAAQGADLLDVGGESTRPGASRVSEAEEAARVLPVIDELTQAGIPISIDTMRASVARQAVIAGACVVNDVSGGLADGDMLPTVAELEVPVVLMHWRSHSADMDKFTHYDNVVAEVIAHLSDRAEAAMAAGIDSTKIIVDPGLGFAKLPEHNWALLHALPNIAKLGFPILIAASRKRFLGAALASESGEPRAIEDRGAATDAVSALAALAGAWGVRVHEVPGTLDAVRVAQAWKASDVG